ncbi:hypothetical protein [Methylocystis parvus]|uniref:Histidine phosphatase family protein n=1 Tax=Methylocystis parvus TaxID=134 RepID=A0A6B8M590_9HYPH|nr:hypothetical protein [Methylocystis parvus]QGM98101.1 hypothetical protein F7D14_11850 [Methylocystis parvus]WBK01578.1 hypothetical protein MMG94_07725 [Methylocystis parvus OBBP]
MASIILVRHGPVALQAPGLLSFQEFVDYCEAYERSGLAPRAQAPGETVARLRDVCAAFASTTMRARESARALGLERAVFDSCFSEEPNVAPRIAGRWPLIFWFAASRGRGAYHPAAERARDAMRRRARIAAQILIGASATGPAALVGHGWFNREIARALAEDGWRVARGATPSFGRVAAPWGCAVFERAS